MSNSPDYHSIIPLVSRTPVQNSTSKIFIAASCIQRGTRKTKKNQQRYKFHDAINNARSLSIDNPEEEE